MNAIDCNDSLATLKFNESESIHRQNSTARFPDMFIDLPGTVSETSNPPN